MGDQIPSLIESGSANKKPETLSSSPSSSSSSLEYPYINTENVENSDIFEAYESLGITSDNFEGVDCGCCRCGGRITRQIVGSIMAFLSGLFFTANNFIIKAAKLSFGEIIAVRS